jgi:hypothetical protein
MNCYRLLLFFLIARHPLVGLLIIKASRSHSDTPHIVGLLWMSDQNIAETSISTTYNIFNRQTSISPVGFVLAVSTSERPQTHTLDRAASETVVKQFSFEFLYTYEENVNL